MAESRRRCIGNGWGGIATVLVAAGLAAALGLRGRKMRKIAPAFRSPALLLPVTPSPLKLPLLRHAISLLGMPKPPAGTKISERKIPGPAGASDVRVLLFEREGRATDSAAMIWVHGGGYVLGGPELDARLFFRILDRLDMLIVSVDYRLAPENAFPAPLDDCHAALTWLQDLAEGLSIDRSQIAVGGVSAGGGLAAALAQRAFDEKLPVIAQLLIYPMLDDRTVLSSDNAGRGEFVWTPASNRWGWHSYLGREPGEIEARPYAVPARRGDLRGLPSTWIGVGTLDLFHNEDVAYAERLEAAGVTCKLEVVDGAYHSFDSLAFETAEVQAFHRSMIDILEGVVT